jgi:hypothetical protein
MPWLGPQVVLYHSEVLHLENIMGKFGRGPRSYNNNAQFLLRSLPFCLLTSGLVIALFLHSLDITRELLLMLSSSTTTCDPAIIYRGPPGLPPLKNRNELGNLLEARQLHHGVEVGVQRGRFSRDILSRWPTCQSFTLIDLWAQQTNYVDGANVADNVQEQIYQEALSNVAQFGSKVNVLRMLSSEAALQVADHSLDFVYIDARHDYCGVLEDLTAYWPKLRPGGIMAGHDFMTTAEVKSFNSKSNWSICHDGSVHESAVKGAVEYFAKQQGLVVSVMYDENARFPSWMVQKPTRPECVVLPPTITTTTTTSSTTPALFTIVST